MPQLITLQQLRQAEKRKWIGRTLNDLFGIDLYANLSVCKAPIMIIRETISRNAEHTEFTVGD